MHEPNIPPRRTILVRLTVALASAWLALGLAACGSSSPATAAASEQEGERESATKLADFARCMREHGVQAEVSAMPGGGQGLKIGAHGPAGGREKVGAAQTACKKYQPEPKKVDLSPQKKVEREEAVQKFARCMRENGIEVHASVSGGGIQVQIHGHPGSGPNPETPAFQKAQNTCQKFMAKLKLPNGPGTSKQSGEVAGASLSTGG
jgi:hypothetical protein